MLPTWDRVLLQELISNEARDELRNKKKEEIIYTMIHLINHQFISRVDEV